MHNLVVFLFEYSVAIANCGSHASLYWLDAKQTISQSDGGHISVNAQCLGVYDCKLRPRGREIYSHKPLTRNL